MSFAARFWFSHFFRCPFRRPPTVKTLLDAFFPHLAYSHCRFIYLSQWCSVLMEATCCSFVQLTWVAFHKFTISLTRLLTFDVCLPFIIDRGSRSFFQLPDLVFFIIFSLSLSIRAKKSEIWCIKMRLLIVKISIIFHFYQLMLTQCQFHFYFSSQLSLCLIDSSQLLESQHQRAGTRFHHHHRIPIEWNVQQTSLQCFIRLN